jgi:hypothetical protein
MSSEKLNAPGNITLSEAQPEAYFTAVYDACQQGATAAGGFIDRYYLIGGRAVRLRYAGPALTTKLTQAFAHLASGEVQSPALTVYLWDSGTTRQAVPAPPWQLDDYVARGEISGYNTARFHTVYQLGSDTLSLFDAVTSTAIFWVRDVSCIQWYEIAAPIRAILHWWAGSNGLQLVHAGAVGTTDGGVVITGKGGVGKSTTTLACLEAGLLYAGDDYVLLEAAPAPFVHSLYGSAKLDSDALQRVPHLSPTINNHNRQGDEKAVLFLRENYGGRMTAGFPVKAILIPHITGRCETSLQPISIVAALKALAPSTIFQLPGAGEAAFQRLAEFAQKVPAYRLNLGTDLAAIPVAIRRLLLGLES